MGRIRGVFLAEKMIQCLFVPGELPFLCMEAILSKSQAMDARCIFNASTIKVTCSSF